MNTIKFAAIATLAALVLAAGCNKPTEDTIATTPGPSAVVKPPAGMPSLDAFANVDFSSPEKINETVVPALKDLLAKNPILAGSALNVELKEKILHIKGDVANNDQKRAIDEVVKPLIEKAKAAGINILNGAIVKG